MLKSLRVSDVLTGGSESLFIGETSRQINDFDQSNQNFVPCVHKYYFVQKYKQNVISLFLGLGGLKYMKLLYKFL